ncbi:MAG: FAD-binding protein [Rubrivivax sp.]|nr:FAD-binding protein [Rubrivivax sp.]
MEFAPHRQLLAALSGFIPERRLVTDPLRLLTWGSDASFYRLVPQLIVVVEDEAELVRLLALCHEFKTPLTFRAAGTSLSGQVLRPALISSRSAGLFEADRRVMSHRVLDGVRPSRTVGRGLRQAYCERHQEQRRRG